MDTIANGIIMASCSDRWRLHRGEHGILYRVVKSPGCTPEPNVTLYVDHTSSKKKKKTGSKREGNNQKDDI